MTPDPFAANDDDAHIARVRRVLWRAGIGALVLLGLLAWGLAEASNFKRSTKARDDFRRANPCPATGDARPPCPGYVIDHVIALCEGGPDTPANMQWLTTAEAREKDLATLKRCRPAGPAYRGGK